jgi:DNA-binding PucR family transcriptional regulator
MALAHFPADELTAIPDVEAIAKISANDPSGEHIRTLDAFCHAGSLRRTAAELYLHHTSVAARLTHISSSLGYAVDTPDGAFRARMALTLWQLAQDPDFDRQMVRK